MRRVGTGAWCRGLAVVALPVLLAVGCAPAEDAVPEVRLGVIVQADSIEGPPTVQSVQLAVDQVNAEGGLKVGDRRRHVSVAVTFSGARPEDVARGALRLINQERVVALIGPNLSRSAIPISRAANDARVPMLTPGATDPAVTAGKPFAFRVTYTDPVQGSGMARFAREELSATTAAVLYDVTNETSRGLARVFRESFTAAGGEMVAFESFVAGREEIEEQLERIRAARPEVLFLPNFTTLVREQAQQLRSLGISATLLGGDSWSSAILAEVPELDGSYLAAAWHLSAATGNPRTEAFLEAYREAWGELPAHAAPVLAYDAVGMVFEALRRAGQVAPEALRDELAQIADFPGVTGSLTFRGTDGDLAVQGVILELRDGEVRYVKRLEPFSASP